MILRLSISRAVLLLACTCYTLLTQAQTFSEPVQTIKLTDSLIIKAGNIAQGHFIPEDFTTMSYKSCFPPKHADLYTGKHIFYGFQMPKHTQVTIILNAKVHLSLYTFQLPANDFSSFPPNIASGICLSNSTQPDSTTGEWTITLQTGQNDNNVIIGIAGANKIELGNFVLRIQAKSDIPVKEGLKTKTPKAYRLNITGSDELLYQGSFANAALIPVQWASQAPANCIGLDQLDRLKKEHIYYLLKVPAGQTLNLDISPADQQASIGAWVITGHDGASLPPDIRKSTACTLYESKIPGGSCAISINNPATEETNVLIGIFVDRFKDPNFSIKLKMAN